MTHQLNDLAVFANRVGLYDAADLMRNIQGLVARMVPEGWVVVPIVPTQGMCMAGSQYLADLHNAWSAMLAVAPKSSVVT